MDDRKANLRKRTDGRYSLSVVNDGVTFLIELSEDELSHLRRHLNGLAGSGKAIPAEIKTQMVDMFLAYDDWFPMLEPLNDWFDAKLK